MIYTDLAGRYFDWLYERVCGDWEPRGLSFHRLLTFLYNQNFTPSCELDGARAEDGLDLRYRVCSDAKCRVSGRSGRFRRYSVQHA